MEVLTKLKMELQKRGIDRFKEIKYGEYNIMCTCPNHANGQEKKASCGISNKEVKGLKTGQVHCFTCGYTVSLPEMISNCFGYNDYGVFGEKWLIENFVIVEVENRKILNLGLERQKKNKKIEFVSEEELDTYRYYHKYMYERKLTNEVIEKFDVGFDKKTNCLTFPVKDKKGNVLFIARRSVDTKYFNYPQGVDKSLYGIYELDSTVNDVIICESIINALTCYVYGKQAVALLGTGNEKQIKQLQSLKQRKLIFALDPDNAGKNATKRIKNKLKNKLTVEYEIPKGKDINDLTFEEFKNLKEFF